MLSLYPYNIRQSIGDFANDCSDISINYRLSIKLANTSWKEKAQQSTDFLSREKLLRKYMIT